MTNIQRERGQDKSAKAEFLKLNRNFCKNTVARDVRSSEHWPFKRDSERDVLQCQPPDERFFFEVGFGAPVSARRCPTGFDTRVWFALQHKADTDGVVWFKSFAALLEELQLTAHADNYRHVRQALELGEHLSIGFDRWYVPAKYQGQTVIKKGHFIQRVLPPPIRSFKSRHNTLTIELSEEWMTLGDRYFQKVPRLLPTSAAVQNVGLKMLAADCVLEDGWREVRYRRRALTRQCGLNHSHRNEVLKTVLKQLEPWMEAYGGAADCKVEKLDVVFRYQPPDFIKPKSKLERARKPTKAKRKPKPMDELDANNPDDVKHYFRNLGINLGN